MLIDDVREQVLYLKELGLETFDAQLLLRVGSSELGVASEQNLSAGAAIFNKMVTVAEPVGPRPAVSRLSSLPSLSSLSKRTTAVASATKSSSVSPTEKITAVPATEQLLTQIVAEASLGLPDPSESIDQIRAEIGPQCTRCKLSELGRTQVVHSTGNFNAQLMFVGEAPGKDEDEQGFPFVGRAGKLLTDIMMAIGFNREDVFIGNINRCRPPENRAPEPDETIACKPFLKREIAVVRPKVIVVLGATAAHNLLETKVPIGKLRGQFHDYLGTKVMPTFHPAYLLRDPHKKREVWDDMKMVRDYLGSL